MSNATTLVKCLNCGSFNEGAVYCKECGQLISHSKKEELRKAAFKQKQIEQAQWRIENPNLAERLKKHPNIVLRIVGWILYSAFMVVSAIGAGLAWFVAMVAAG